MEFLLVHFVYQSKVSEHGHFILKNKKEAYLGCHFGCRQLTIEQPHLLASGEDAQAASQQGRKAEREMATFIRDHIPKSKVREFRASFALFFYVTHKEANQHPVNATLTPLRGCSVVISLHCHLTEFETPRRHSSECVSKGFSQRVFTEVGRPVLRVRSVPWAGIPNRTKMGKRESQVNARILCSQLLIF